MFGGNPNGGLGDYIQNGSFNADNQPQHLNPSQSSMTVDYRYMKPTYTHQQQQAPYPTNNCHQQKQGYGYAQGGIPSSSALPFNNEHYPPDHHYNGNSIALNPQANIGPYTTTTLADDYSLETPPSQQLYTDNQDQEPPNHHQQYLQLQPSVGDNLVWPFLSETERASADIMNAYAYPNEQMERQEAMQESHSNQQDSAIDFYVNFNQQQFEQYQKFQINSLNQQALLIPKQSARLETISLIANAAGGDYIDLSPPSEIHTNSSYSQDEMESDLVNSVLNYQAEDHSQCQTFSQEQQQNSIPSNGSENVQNLVPSTSGTFESNAMANSSTGPLTSSTIISTPDSSLFGFGVEREIDEGSVSTRTSAEEVSQELGTQPNNNEMMPVMEVHSVNKIRTVRCKELMEGKKCAQNQQQQHQQKCWNWNVLNWYRKRPKLMKGNCNENGELDNPGAPTTSAAAYRDIDDRMSTSSSHRLEPIEMPAADDQTDNDPINELKKEHVKLEEWINNQTKQSIGPEWNIDQQMKIFDGILKRCTELKTKVNDSHPEIEKLLKWDYENCIFLYQPNPWMYGKPKPVEKKNKKGETNKIEAKCKHTCYETEIFPFWHRIFDKLDSVSLNGDCQVIALLNEDKASQIQNSDKIEVSPCKGEISKYMKCRIEIINSRGICKIKSEIIRDKDENAAMINEKQGCHNTGFPRHLPGF